MPLYEDRNNAENKIIVSEGAKKSLVFGSNDVIRTISETVSRGTEKKTIAFDGWYGIDWNSIIVDLRDEILAEGKTVTFINANSLFKNGNEISRYKQNYITKDPSFGWVNIDGCVQDIMDDNKIFDMQNILKSKTFEEDILIVYSPGAAIKELKNFYDLIYFFDKKMQSVLWMMWNRTLIPFGKENPDQDYFWKEFFYCDYYLLLRQKEYIIDKINYFLEANEFSELKLLPREAYDEIIQTLVKYPIKEVDYYQPGPWGAYRFKDFVDIPGLENNAWHLAIGPDLSLLIDLSAQQTLNLPFNCVMQYSEEMVGTYINNQYPSLFPVHVAIDDGYFPEPQPYERTSMPMHNHPSSAYVKRHFNEPMGRYETYYIAEAFEGATTWMGYKDDADLEKWEDKCRDADNKVLIEDWKEYVRRWDTKTGDLFLIPPGTIHGHGGNQIVLEMDTCPSICAAEYSFFLHDFARNTWDDKAKTMTAKPMRMHLEHGFDNEHWRRESWVEKYCRSSPKVVKWTKEFCMERYSTLPEMPFEIERFHFYSYADYNTYNRFFHVVCLTIGKLALIRSKTNPELFAEIKYMQCAIIPASFGEYEMVSRDGNYKTIVLYRMKKS